MIEICEEKADRIYGNRCNACGVDTSDDIVFCIETVYECKKDCQCGAKKAIPGSYSEYTWLCEDCLIELKNKINEVIK